uniref:Uncharacterized protein n=1 Tax=Triticum urartu TaxID=4572 RepID=A0A8R7PZX0_TRIUA
MAATSPTAGSAAHATRGAGGAEDCIPLTAAGAAEPKGANAESGSSASGLGGLGLDGMVAATSDGASASSPGPGEGSSGIMSGESESDGESAEGALAWRPPWRGCSSGYCDGSGAAEMADARSAPAWAAGTHAHVAQSARAASRRAWHRPRAPVLAIVGCACVWRGEREGC